MIVHEGGELELVTEQRRRLAIGAALLQLAHAAGRAVAFAEAGGLERIAEVRTGPDGKPTALLVAMP